MVIINSPGNPTGAVYTERGTRGPRRSRRWPRTSSSSPTKSTRSSSTTSTKHVSIASLSEELYEPHHHRQWLLQSLLDDRLAPRLHRRARRPSPTPSTPSRATRTSNADHLRAIRRARRAQRRPAARRATCATNSTCAASSCSTASQASTTSRVVEPKGAFYFLVNIGKHRPQVDELRRKAPQPHKVAVVPGIAFGADESIRFSYAPGSMSSRRPRPLRGILPRALIHRSENDSSSPGPQGSGLFRAPPPHRPSAASERHGRARQTSTSIAWHPSLRQRSSRHPRPNSTTAPGANFPT